MEQITKYGNFLTKINTNTEIGPGKSYMIIPLQSDIMLLQYFEQMSRNIWFGHYYSQQCTVQDQLLPVTSGFIVLSQSTVFTTGQSFLPLYTMLYHSYQS